ncbi:DNA translocase FtsK 4TM domain-containing protein [Myxococcota bacterium]|nr:DNA translocase FtsK 4TM domain-containing protein [Myxococcota bacterium]
MARQSKKPKAKSKPKETEKAVVTGSAHQEASAVILVSVGLLSFLSLLSYNPQDASLNASGSTMVHNWIGPAGSYLADFLLQMLGIGAFALSFGLFLAGIRALVGRRINPGFREFLGIFSLMISSGTLAHLMIRGGERTYPAGGVPGAILGDLLLQNFAVLGAYIVAAAFVLLSLVLAADGILVGLGLHGVSMVRTGIDAVTNFVRATIEKQKTLRAERAALASDDAPQTLEWSFGPGEHADERRDKRNQRREKVLEKARLEAEEQVRKETEEARLRALRTDDEPELVLGDTIDLPGEEDYEMGELPEFSSGQLTHEKVEEPQVGEDLVEAVVELVEEDMDIEVPILAAEFKPSEIKSSVEAEEPELEPVCMPPESVAKESFEEVIPNRVPLAKITVEPEIIDERPDMDAAEVERAAAENIAQDGKTAFMLPSAQLLDIATDEREPIDPVALREEADQLTKTLKDYGIKGIVREIRPGPVVTMYEFVPTAGTKISKIAGLSDDIAMSMKALRVRIVAPLPGKGAVGIEIPNQKREMVFLKEVIAHDDFKKSKSMLTMGLGKDIEGNVVMQDLAKMPHLLVAGATGAGKSVSVNGMIMSILFKATPEDVRMIMIDPKMLEFKVYDGIPHLLLPVVVDPKKAALALRWVVDEMERRYHMLSSVNVRNLAGYNTKVEKAKERGERLRYEDTMGDEQLCEKVPQIVVIVDEFADLMTVASKDVETAVMRLAQKARAAGIHVILATQRPSVDVITGVIKANFPTRIAFQVASGHDSRTIIGGNGAEQLLGKGDMLFLAPGVGGLSRVHGAFVSDEEVERTADYLREQGTPIYDETILAPRDDGGELSDGEEEYDEYYDQAVAIVTESRKASISMIQRRLRIGYNRSARLVETMEREGIVGPANGANPRDVLVNPPPPMM